MAQLMTDVKAGALAQAYDFIDELWGVEFKHKTGKEDILFLIKRILFNFADTEFTANEYNEFLGLLKD